MDESIYDLVPVVPEDPPKPPMHRSKHDPVAAPTYSTFPKKERPPGTRDGTAAILFAGRSGAIGRDVGPSVDPKSFLRSHSDRRASPGRTAGSSFQRSLVAPPKPPVPPRDDKPVMGLMTEKNFVHSNAVEAALSPSSKRGPVTPTLATQRTDFATVPAYLKRLKQQIEDEKNDVARDRRMQDEQHARAKEQYVRTLDEKEKEDLIAALRIRWEEKHRQYHSLPFAQDTAMSIARKEAIERELKEIEVALGKLSKHVVVVYNDTQGPAIANWAKSTAMQDASSAAARLVNQSIAAKSLQR